MLVNQTCCRVYTVKHTAGLIQSKCYIVNMFWFVQFNMFQNLLCQKYCTAYKVKYVAQCMPSNWLQVVLSIKHVAQFMPSNWLHSLCCQTGCKACESNMFQSLYNQTCCTVYAVKHVA